MILVGCDIMVPNKFSMVDLDGIDIVESQGVEIPGLYQKLVNAIAQCRYQVIYNWKFDSILIPPSYVEMVMNGSEVKINSNISVSDADIVYIHSLEPPAPEPVINSLLVSENGVYTAPEGVDGFDPVTVNVPAPQPVIESKTITENGVYNAPIGVDGYNPVVVNVQGVGRLNIYSGLFDIRDGTVTENADYYYTDFVDISNYRGNWFIDISRTSLNTYNIGCCFYDDNGNAVDYVRQYSAYRVYSNTNNFNPVKFRIAGKMSEIANLSVIHIPSFTRVFGSLGNNFVANI